MFNRLKAWLAGSNKNTATYPSGTAAIAFNDETNIQNVVPYDENLLERSRTQWQFGDWASLTAISRDTLQHHPDRAKLALLTAAGHQALGNAAGARQHTRLAMDWGCSKKLVTQILIAGVHNTLGRAAAVSGQEQRALKHFRASLQTGAANSDVQLLTQARVAQQLAQMGLPADSVRTSLNQTAALRQPSQLNILQPQQKAITVKLKTQINLGQAWAANTVNTVVFRHHAILTSGRQQFTAFYVNEQTLRLVQRDLDTEHIATHDIPGQYNLRDAHNSISLGLDRADHLHLSYDHHATQLRYRRATRSLSITDWTAELQMTGAHEETVTYPTFILPHHGYPLTLLYRDGTHVKGSARIKTFDEDTQTWADHPNAILSGSEQKPWTSNAYWNHPAVGSDGTLHLSFVWRIQGMGEEDLVNNVNIGYAASPDNGLTWHTTHGRPYKLPITQVNAETIWPVAPGSNLINQCSMAVDSANRPHIAFYANDAAGIPQYQHVWFDGITWKQHCISQRTQAFDLTGGGTLQLPISRPVLLLDKADNAHIIYRGDLSQNHLAVTVLKAPDYAYEPNHPGQTQTLWAHDLGYAEPIIDRTRWDQDNTLTLLLQPNAQPDGDKDHDVKQETVFLADFQGL